MKKALTLIFAMALATSTFAIQPEKVKPVKNIILMVTDGTSISVVGTSRWLKVYRSGSAANPVTLNIDPWLCGYARFRLPRHADVPHRPLFRRLARRRQTLLPAQPHSAAPHHQFPVVLHRPDHDAHRHATLPRRLPRRPHQPLVAKSERLSD